MKLPPGRKTLALLYAKKKIVIIVFEFPPPFNLKTHSAIADDSFTPDQMTDKHDDGDDDDDDADSGVSINASCRIWRVSCHLH